MLDKITRFRQDIRIEIVALFINVSENDDIWAPWYLSLWNCAHEWSLEQVVSQRYCGSASFVENLIHAVKGRNVLLSLYLHLKLRTLIDQPQKKKSLTVSHLPLNDYRMSSWLEINSLISTLLKQSSFSCDIEPILHVSCQWVQTEHFIVG